MNEGKTEKTNHNIFQIFVFSLIIDFGFLEHRVHLKKIGITAEYSF